MARGRALSLVVIVAALSPTTPVRAGGGADEVARAHAMFEIGRQHFRIGDYDAAIADFEHGYAIEPQPLFLYNIGVAAERGGRCARAAEAWRAFLASQPSASERNEARGRLESLPRTCVERATPPAPSSAPADRPSAPANRPPAATPGAPAPATPGAAAMPPGHAPPSSAIASSRRRRIAGGLLLGAGAAALASGATLEAIAVADNDRIAHPAAGAVFDVGVERQRDTFHPIGVTLLAVGSAAVIAGVLLVALPQRADRGARASR